MEKWMFLIVYLLAFNLTYSQYKNVEQLPQKLRDSLLIDVANKAISKYSEGYLRPGATPFIEDLGPLKKETLGLGTKYLGVYFFAVYYKGTEEEQKYFGRDYLVKAFIRADNCRVVVIRYVFDFIVISGLDSDEMMNKEWEHKWRFESVEELKARKRNLIRTTIIETPDSVKRRYERMRQIKDSILRENKRKYDLRRKAEAEQKSDTCK